MTIIAYKDGRLAADRRSCTGNDILTPPRVKLFTTSQGVFGGCGATLADKTKSDVVYDISRGKRHVENIDVFAMVMLTDQPKVFIVQYGQVFEHDPATPHAIGSGAEVALGAMAAGASAREAVEIACRLCVTCGDGCDVWPIPDTSPDPDVDCFGCGAPSYGIHSSDCEALRPVPLPSICPECQWEEPKHARGCTRRSL